MNYFNFIIVHVYVRSFYANFKYFFFFFALKKVIPGASNYRIEQRNTRVHSEAASTLWNNNSKFAQNTKRIVDFFAKISLLNDIILFLYLRQVLFHLLREFPVQMSASRRSPDEEMVATLLTFASDDSITNSTYFPALKILQQAVLRRRQTCWTEVYFFRFFSLVFNAIEKLESYCDRSRYIN